MVDDKYKYEKRGVKQSRVGQAVYDILSKSQPNYTAEEILEEMSKGILSYLEEAIDKATKEYDEKFYIIHLFKKTLSQHEIDNAMSQKAHCFIKGPTNPKFFMDAAPGPTKTLYEVDTAKGTMKLLWTVPGKEDCISIKKNPDLYDPDLIKWIDEALAS